MTMKMISEKTIVINTVNTDQYSYVTRKLHAIQTEQWRMQASSDLCRDVCVL